MRLATYNQKISKKLELTTQLTFLNRLARLLQRNHSMKQALAFLTFDPQLGELAKRFVEYLEEGESMEDCFRLLHFQPLVIAFLFLSGESGNISDHIIHLNRLLTMKLEFEKKLKQLLRYPLFLLVVCIILFILLNTFLLPLYEQSFSGMGNNGALSTYQVFMTIIQTAFFIILTAALFACLGLIYFHKTLKPEQKINLYEKIPIFRSVFRLLITGQLSYQLAALLHSGKTMKESLMVIEQQNHMPFLQYFAQLLTDNLKKGLDLHRAFKDLPLIESEFKLMIRRGTEQGTLPEDLRNYTSLVIDSTEEKIKKSMMIIQPIIYGVLGIMIILIYAFTLFPMFQMINQI